MDSIPIQFGGAIVPIALVAGYEHFLLHEQMGTIFYCRRIIVYCGSMPSRQSREMAGHSVCRVIVADACAAFRAQFKGLRPQVDFLGWVTDNRALWQS
jgi:hypothetical protein